MERVGKNPKTTTRGEDTCREMKVKSEECKLDDLALYPVHFCTFRDCSEHITTTPHVSFVYLVVFKSSKNTKVHIDLES
jgi:hypothetical protein